jgi:hypothetical protein
MPRSTAIAFLLILPSFCGNSFARDIGRHLFPQTLTSSWLRQAGTDTVANNAASITFDSAGNCYLFGTRGSIAYDAPLDTLFITRYRVDGTISWTRRIYPSYSVFSRFCRAKDIAASRNGNIYVTGMFDDSLFLADTILKASGGINIFLAKYDSSGTLLWAKSFGADQENRVNSLTLDRAGNPYLCGYYKDVTYIGDSTFRSAEHSYDAFIAKFLSDGSFQWAHTAGGRADEEPVSITAGPSGRIYVLGIVNSQDAAFDTLRSLGKAGTFIACYDPKGNILWVRRAGFSGTSSSDAVNPNAIAVDSSERITMIGNTYVPFTSDTLFFDSIRVPVDFGIHMALAQYDSIGSIRWANVYGGGSGVSIYPRSLATRKGAIYATGYFQATVVFGSDTISTPGNNGLFLTKFTENGAPSFAKNLTSSQSHAYGECISTAVNGDIFLAGEFQFKTLFLGEPMQPVGSESDIFVWKLHDDEPGAVKPETLPLLSSALSIVPNPASASIHISVTKSKMERTLIIITDILGAYPLIIYNGDLDRGKHVFDFDAHSLPTGSYFLRLISPSASNTTNLKIVR